VLTLVAMSADATQRPQNMPFAVTGSSPVVTAAQSAKLAGKYQMSFVNRLYANENEVMNATSQGEVYGAYLLGTTSDTLLTVPSKSFFATFVITGELGRPAGTSAHDPAGQATAKGQRSVRHRRWLAAASIARGRLAVSDAAFQGDRSARAAVAGGASARLFDTGRPADARDRRAGVRCDRG
jgi:hypothetical protein